MPSLSSIADETERDAEDLESEFRRLALTLFALELAIMAKLLANATSQAEVLQALRLASLSYRAPNGFFRQSWERRFEELMRDVASRSQRLLPVVGPKVEVPLLPRAAVDAIQVQAQELAAAVTEVSARKVDAVRVAVTGGISARGAPLPTSAFDQRLETLVPLVGREAATEIMAVVEAKQGSSIRNVAKELLATVHSTEINRKRAAKIARNESLGLVLAQDFERAATTGVLREKRWITQGDDRVRESHVRCGAEGWLPIQAVFSNGLRYPHERPSPPSETAGCRCSQAFRA